MEWNKYCLFHAHSHILLCYMYVSHIALTVMFMTRENSLLRESSKLERDTEESVSVNAIVL